MKRVVFYCQHLEGIGHLARSIRLANELSREFFVTLINGGPPTSLKPRVAVRVAQLDPLWMRDGKLEDSSGKRSVDEVFLLRKARLQEIAQYSFDAVIVELFPFGRKKFEPEILEFLAGLKKSNDSIKTISSVRDVLVEKKEDRSVAVAGLVREYFDRVWVHSDPTLLPLNFPMELIGERAVYTGFVAEAPRKFSRGKEPLIVVSAGGGFRGKELFLAAAQSVAHFPNHRFHFVFGPYADYRAEIEEILKPFGDRVHFSGLVEDFEGLLARAALSISMGGYNTAINLLRARVPALILPYAGDQEQGIRALALEQKGYLGVIRNLAELPKLINERMGTIYPGKMPDLNGATQSLALLSGMFAK